MNRFPYPPLVSFAFILCATSASASSRGVIGTDCGGCHGYEGDASITLSPATTASGTTTTLRIAVADAQARVGGLFLKMDDPSQLSPLPGSGLALVTGGMTHTSPGSFSGGQLIYEVQWQVPPSPGATHFSVAAVAANGNGNNSGDAATFREFDVVYGCEPQSYFQDGDGDGFGDSSRERLGCADSPPAGYAAAGGDCADSYASRYPGAPELCNGQDDDCDGEVDEEAIPVELYPDEDGDGFYSDAERESGEMLLGCVPTAGYAAFGGDCAPDNAAAHPGATEVCDLVTDEDCDGRIDERVVPICGVGWCSRQSFSCDPADCSPGAPAEESCNLIDDDCDGEVDEGELCEPGFLCAAGQCLDAKALSLPPETADSEPLAGSAGSYSEDDQGDVSGSANSGCSLSPPAPRDSTLLAALAAGLVGLLRRRSRRKPSW